MARQLITSDQIDLDDIATNINSVNASKIQGGTMDFNNFNVTNEPWGSPALTAADVGSAYKDVNFGDIGSLVLAYYTLGALAANSTVSGSNLIHLDLRMSYDGTSNNTGYNDAYFQGDGVALTGSWKNLQAIGAPITGFQEPTRIQVALFIKVA